MILIYVYGSLLLLGGIIGYAKAKSLPSLVAGGGSGLVAILLGFLYYRWHYAPHAVLILSLLLTVIMGSRYSRTRKPMPALPVIALSVLVAMVQFYVILFMGLGNAPR